VDEEEPFGGIPDPAASDPGSARGVEADLAQGSALLGLAPPERPEDLARPRTIGARSPRGGRGAAAERRRTRARQLPRRLLGGAGRRPRHSPPDPVAPPGRGPPHRGRRSGRSRVASPSPSCCGRARGSTCSICPARPPDRRLA
jgi:hypothetical protein